MKRFDLVSVDKGFRHAGKMEEASDGDYVLYSDVRELITELKVTAALHVPEDDNDDFDPKDYSGGNFDDCYGMGVSSGVTAYARDLLAEFFPKEDTTP